MRSFEREQRGVVLGMAGALATTVTVVGVALALDHAAPPRDLADRLAHALRAELPVVAWLAAAIADVARRRFFSARDIAGGGGDETPAVARARAILQNTLEQVVLASAAQAIVAATIARSARLSVALAALFALGRLLFWLGYRHGARARALGFGLSFYPSVAALLVAGVALVAG
ncbi:MAPEG family protein [Sphingomonas sp. RHCKR7]|uniref:MAPEG family protein n=1 Tax=Sphingomonas folli TaxID=2862497 RepID=UPI001CA5B243|nr:MAPEG family protein [Sphingomonas folli]MBW6529099.1 MAPEG family protein [Sphingomonas folli]